MKYCYKQWLFTINMLALQITNFVFMLSTRLAFIISVLHIPLCCTNTYSICLNIRCEPFPNLSAEAQPAVTFQPHTNCNTFSTGMFPANWRLWRAVILCSGKYGVTTGHHLTNKSWIPFMTWSAAICNLYMRYWILVLSTCQFIISYRRNCEMNPGFGPTNLRLDFTLEQD